MIIQLEQARVHLREIQPQIEELAVSLRIDALNEKCEKLEKAAAEPDFWLDPENSQKILAELKEVKETLSDYRELSSLFTSTMELLDLAIADKGEKVAVMESRKQAAQYLFGLRDAASYRREICEAKTREEVAAILRRALLKEE